MKLTISTTSIVAVYKFEAARDFVCNIFGGSVSGGDDLAAVVEKVIKENLTRKLRATSSIMAPLGNSLASAK
jgi:hypothetical protein